MKSRNLELDPFYIVQCTVHKLYSVYSRNFCKDENFIFENLGTFRRSKKVSAP